MKLDPEIVDLIERYESGLLSHNETMLHLLTIYADLDPSRSWDLLPDAWQQAVRTDVASAPATDNGWAGMRVFHAGSSVKPVPTEQWEAESRNKIARYRRGVEAVRAMFGESQS